MPRPLIGFRFRMQWPCSGYVVIVNARHQDEAEGKLGRWKRKGAEPRLLGTTEPLPKEPKRIPNKVF